MPITQAVPTVRHREGTPKDFLLILPNDGMSLRDIQREACLQALERSGWSWSVAAQTLRMSTRVLAATVQALGITDADRAQSIAEGRTCA